MTFRVLRTLAISASFLILAAACSSDDGDGVNLQTPWLGSLHGFERVSGEDQVGVFLKTTSGATARVDRSIILPPEITVSARSDLESISPEIYESIRILFSEVFRQELAKQIQVVEAGADRSAASHLIKTALTKVTVTRRSGNPVEGRLSDLQFSFEDAKIEAEFRVSQSNARRAVIVLPATAEKTDWNGLREQLSVFSRQAAAETAKAVSAINAKADQAPTVKAPAS